MYAVRDWKKKFTKPLSTVFGSGKTLPVCWQGRFCSSHMVPESLYPFTNIVSVSLELDLFSGHDFV